MAVLADHPYGAFRFLVDLGTGETDGPRAGFSEVSGLDLRVKPLTYRAGNYREARLTVLPGLAPPAAVTFARGVIGDLSLYQWLRTALEGGRRDHLRSVVVTLLSETREPAMTWKLSRVVPTALLGPRFDAQLGAVAVERLTVLAEALEIE